MDVAEKKTNQRIEPNDMVAVFVSRFDQRSAFVSKALKRAIADFNKVAARPVRLVRLDESIVSGDVVQELRAVLADAVVAVVDLTPLGTPAKPQWNANVFYELGMIHQLGVPPFLICDETFRPHSNGPDLPFNIAGQRLDFYQFSPDGLSDLGETFARWLENGLTASHSIIRAYEESQFYVRPAREIKQLMYEWRGPWAPGFRQLIARLVVPIQKEAIKIESFLQDIPSSRYVFTPPQRTEAIEELFIAMMESLEAEDVYSTLSTTWFWRSFADNGTGFFRACRDRLVAGVNIRRLMVVADKLEPGDDRILADHCRLAAVHPNYELKLLHLPRRAAQLPRGHVGICHRKAINLVTAFKPTYSNDKPPKVSGIELDNNAAVALSSFEAEWAQATWYADDNYIREHVKP